jgi:uncharacterized repeat protein (TIGR03803 family)
MNHRFDELAKELDRSTTWGKVLRKTGFELTCVVLACGGTIAWADWTPPESGVTPPAVVTLDAFATPGANGANPSAALVAGLDGALYGSTPNGGASGAGTLFRLETNGTFTKLHDFNYTDGYYDGYPSAALVVGSEGALYGSTPSGGTNGHGTLFRVESNGALTKLHDFNGTNDGYDPMEALVVGPDGALYGSSSYGGTDGYGTLFRLETNGRFTKLHDFNYYDGGIPSAALVVGPDGALYGSTYYGGTNGNGTVFRVGTNGAYSKLHDFSSTNDGGNPSAALVVGLDGALYGSTPNGGGSGAGTLFRLETNGTFTKLRDLNYTNDGANPSTALVAGSDGALYGSTRNGGTNLPSVGTLFRLETNGTFTKIHDFNTTNDGAGPLAALVAGPDGALYGSTPYGGTNGYGTLFRVETKGTFTKLYDFNYADGYGSSAALVVGPDGALYGSKPYGGVSLSLGTLFRVDTNGTFTKLYDFHSNNGYEPVAALAVGSDRALYGSTEFGGTNGYLGYGTLFQVEADATFTQLHDFNYTDGEYPTAALVMGPDGALYGLTQMGGTYGIGTLFRVETNGSLTTLHDFNYTNGEYPTAALVVGPDGALYGSTQYGGFYDSGTLFRVDTNGTFTKLHDFAFTEGYFASAALVVGPDGALYGSTPSGGTNIFRNGTLFRLETNGAFTKLHDFNYTDGVSPSAPLVVGPDGGMYGSTPSGGTNGYGTLFRLETDGTFTKLQDFNYTDNGAYLTAPLVVGPDGALYGSTQVGGSFGPGTLFRVETNGTFAKLYDFDGTNGAFPLAALAEGPDGALYGSTSYGGTTGGGTLFRVDTNGIFTKLYDFNGTNGTYPSAALVLGPDGALYGSTQRGGPRGGGILFKLILNRPPVARCHDVTVSAGPNCDADASVDNGSFDPDNGDTITLRQEPPSPYLLGVTPVTLTVTDNHGASNSCTATVTVMDTTPPTISDVVVTPNVLWPPNHKMVGVTVSYDATDNCGGVTNVLVVTSNEATNGPSNGSGPDWVIEDNHHVQLRAERSGSGSGRVYTVAVISVDNAGNASTKSSTVNVPKSRGK